MMETTTAGISGVTRRLGCTKWVKKPQNGQCYVQDLTDFKENNKKSQDVCLWGEETAGDVAEDLLMRARPGFMSEMWQKS